MKGGKRSVNFEAIFSFSFLLGKFKTKFCS